MQQISHTDAFFHVFIAVNRRDAPAGRAEFLVLEPRFLHAVEHDVIGHTDLRLVADLQVFGRDPDAGFRQFADLLCQVLDVDDHAVAHDARDVASQNARGQQIEHEFSLRVDHRVSRVVSALIADDDVLILREEIDHSAFSFISPVDSDDCSEHFRSIPFFEAFSASVFIISFSLRFVKSRRAFLYRSF